MTEGHPRSAALAVEAGSPAHSRVTVRVRGDLDFAGSQALTEALTGLRGERVAEVCIDLYSVPFIDSAGLQALLDARHLFGDRLFIRAGGRARDQLAVTGGDRFLAIR